MNNKISSHKDEIVLNKLDSLESSVKSCRAMLIQIKSYIATVNKRIGDIEKNNGNK